MAGLTAPKFFATPLAFRRWLERHHERETELLVGFYKRDSGRPSMTWPESVDEALSFGWIDGVRKRIDDESYTIRFTPRKRGSIWSSVNVRRANALIAKGRMHPAGLRAFEARDEKRSGIYSYEKRPESLPPDAEKTFRANEEAWRFFEAQAPSYRRVVTHWIVSAKREETRARRLAKAIEDSANGQRIAAFTSPAKSVR